MVENRITHIGKYDVVKMIGRGGMGVVYKATDPLLGRMVAIKMMTGGFADDPELLKRFYREAKSTASLRHPNIVTVYDVGDQAGEPYLVMEFLDGESLDTIISSRRELSLLEKINYIVQVCRGLQYAHERNIIHRDIKPANIMVLAEGLVKIVDFGIARMGDDRVTRPGQVMGSIHYMSPEQTRECNVDARADLFATGAVLYQLLTYTLPFKGDDVRATLYKIMHDAPPPLSTYLTSYPGDLDAIIERALAKESRDRYQTADELAFDLSQVQVQLKSEIVAELLVKADHSTQNGELTTAREHLLELLKLDPQNAPANERMRALQRSIQERRRREQVHLLREEAGEAARQQQFDQALQLIEHAISLDASNPDLRAVKDELSRAKARAELIRDCMNQAESARKENDLDRALSSLDQLLTTEPEYAPAVAMRNEVSRAIALREKERKIHALMEEAQSEMAERRFTEALETLDRLKGFDPNVSNLGRLIELAKEGVEQERRGQLHVLTSEVGDLLERDDYNAALARIETGLNNFPDEPALLRLRTVAERKREIAERRAWVNARISAARNLLHSGKPAEALVALELASELMDRVPAELRIGYDDLQAAINECREQANTMPTGLEPNSAAAARKAEPDITAGALPSASDATTRPMGQAAGSLAHRTAQSNENSVLELTPPKGQVLPDPLHDSIVSLDPGLTMRSSPQSQVQPDVPEVAPAQELSSAVGSSFTQFPGWKSEMLVKVEKELATYLGPVARVLVKKAASTASNPAELYTLLAAHLERDSDRGRFLAGQLGAAQKTMPNPATEERSVTSIEVPPSHNELAQADIERAARVLARYVGPIAGVLTKRTAQRADSLSMLCKLLANNVENDADRERFLRDCGVSNR